MHMIEAEYFDGKSARAHKVRLWLEDGGLAVEGAGIARRDSLASLHVSEPMGAAPRLIKFADGAHCEVRHHVALEGLLKEGGHRDGWVVRLQTRWHWALAAVIITLSSAAAGYRWVLPAVSEWIAFNLPDNALEQMGQSTLTFLDDGVLSPSTLSSARQQTLRHTFDSLAVPDGMAASHQIVFRNSRTIGANAFALPDGTIVVTDQLVLLAKQDQEILAVLAHELGHLNRRHSLRMLIQGSIVGFAVAWYLGDVSNVAAGLPTLMLQARYSRDHEREADEFGSRMLRANGISPARLADMLRRLEEAHTSKQCADKDAESSDVFDGYLASHPATEERIRVLESE